VREVVDLLATWRTVTEETVKVRDEENMVFKLPRQLAN
jgi:4-hydroxy-3-methylbut-2-enyl diphosphate reductase